MVKVTKKNVAAIIAAIGGEDNINMATHCISRLRFQLKDESIVDEAALKEIDIVRGNFSSNGQYQVVIGQGTVDKAYEELIRQTNVKEVTTAELKEENAKKLNPLQKIVKMLADVFIPILPAIVASGLLLGINNVLVGVGIFVEGKSLVDMYPNLAGIAGMISMIAGTAFAFLPALVGWSAVKYFGGNPLMGIVLGLVLVNPALMSAYDIGVKEPHYWNFFGLEVAQIGYQGQVLPVLVAAWVYATIEKGLRRVIPDAFQLLIVAPVTLLVTSALSLIAIGPITLAISNWITDGIVSLSNVSPMITGILFGACFALLVITGMHHAFLAVNLQLISTTGRTMFWPIQALSDTAQGSAALAMAFVTRDKKNRSIALTSALSAYLGITEPAMFGVNLRAKYAFVCSMIGAGLAGGFIAYNGVISQSIGVSGLFSILSITRAGWSAYAIGMVIAIGVPFVLTFIIGLARRKQGNAGF
ncbi:PTS trehalose transporter subunit IIBC [Listeria booriae]|uniref:PTS trehalose transporter subunit IIBC n=1 Tax=Listeria booriae TaxID=1552123 RepID=A0A7X1CL12_9LIST|nr:PTS trehalose transporter subunit IIBC [Listeria booriae]MBC1292951.1 PTS trehalose transporter subunit IIBC [Listeria booriae]MBC1308911.1 PTS trehalose transporter subunit IIBC [Listeria booriae]MBC1333710.1 PTS trehalose transporter subunit IIBC [Listeria booriae]MBC1400033.1 PTS trehalose transporter subunit IIBC [Listeria booriae]MBC1551871.1 PTS trehalose transporter subunit IIBC [Listeria booriae]